MKKLEFLFRQLLLRLLLLFSSGKKNSMPIELNKNSKVLFIRLNRIGDALVVTPLLSLIKEKTGCRIYMLADRKNHFVFRNNPDVDNIIVFDKSLNGIINHLKFIRSEKFDAIVDLHDDVSTTVTYLIALARTENKLGLKKGNEIVYTRTIEKPDPSTNHVVDRNLQIAQLFNLPAHSDNLNIRYFPKKEAMEKVRNTLQKKHNGKFLLGINISAGSESRFWGVDNFRHLLDLLKCYNVYPLLICSTRDLNKALAITNNNREMIFYTPSFDEFASAVSCLDFLFTPDTSIIHLASAFGVPVFGLYVKYNTDDMIWSPYKSDFDCVITTSETLDDISFDEVIIKFKPFLEKHLPL